MSFNNYNDNLRKVPCKGCDHRKANCHASCADYSAFLEDKKKNRTAYLKAHLGDIEVSGMKRDNIQALQIRMCGRKGDKHGKQWTPER